jgi:predicted regulator of Ras-like GTPase activity (Roadblock/LC7/MglB family)
METKAQSLKKVLDELKTIGGIELSAIVSRQGLLMVSKDENGSLSSEAFAALTATLYMSAESTTMRLRQQKPITIIVETEDYQLITYTAGPNALIVVLINNEGYSFAKGHIPQVTFGLILNELKKAAEKVRTIL